MVTNVIAPGEAGGAILAVVEFRAQPIHAHRTSAYF
jgi:hypothetical protein